MGPQPVERVHVSGPKKSWSSERGSDPKRAQGLRPSTRFDTAETLDPAAGPRKHSHGPIRERPSRAQPYPATTQLDAPSPPEGPDIGATPEESDMDVAAQADIPEPQLQLPHREPGSLKEAMDAGWQLVDAGGEGDCGYRAIADALHRQKHAHNLSHDECRAEAAWLRTLMVSHIEKHHDRFESVLVKDKNTAPEEPTPYMGLKSWISEAAKPGTWIDGLALQAIAEKKGVPLVIFKRDAETIKRFTLAPKFRQGMALVAKTSPLFARSSKTPTTRTSSLPLGLFFHKHGCAKT